MISTNWRPLNLKFQRMKEEPLLKESSFEREFKQDSAFAAKMKEVSATLNEASTTYAPRRIKALIEQGKSSVTREDFHEALILAQKISPHIIGGLAPLLIKGVLQHSTELLVQENIPATYFHNLARVLAEDKVSANPLERYYVFGLARLLEADDGQEKGASPLSRLRTVMSPKSLSSPFKSLHFFGASSRQVQIEQGEEKTFAIPETWRKDSPLNSALHLLLDAWPVLLAHPAYANLRPDFSTQANIITSLRPAPIPNDPKLKTLEESLSNTWVPELSDLVQYLKGNTVTPAGIEGTLG